MGFLRRLFGAKKAESSPPAKSKRRWSFNRSSNNTIPPQSQSQSIKRDATYGDNDNNNNSDSNKHAIAVAAATAAVAEAALAAAQAAAEVVRLTGANGGGGRSQFSANRRRWMVEFAAVKIQSAFRGYLARRALRALKALVKLQALVRGHIVRKQTADMLRRMQTLVRLQARARANRSHLTESWRSAANSSLSNHSRCGSSSNFRDIIHLDEAKLGANWLDHWMEESLRNNNGNAPTRNRQEDEKSDKILEVDTWKPHKKSQSIGTFKTSQHVFASDYNRSFAPFDSPSKISTKATNPYMSSGEDVSLNSLKYPLGKDETAYRAVDNSPRVFSPSSRPGSSSSRKGTFTPTRSECSWGVFSGYSGYPNYMANTESFRAKLRSQSAPRQRLEFEKYGMMNRSMQESCYDADTISERGYYAQQTSSRNRAQPSSLNRIGSTNLR